MFLKNTFLNKASTSGFETNREINDMTKDAKEAQAEIIICSVLCFLPFGTEIYLKEQAAIVIAAADATDAQTRQCKNCHACDLSG